LAADGTPQRLVERPYNRTVGAISLIPHDRIVEVGEEWSTGSLFLSILSPDGKHVHLDRTYDPAKQAGWPSELKLQGIYGMHTTPDRFFIFANFSCSRGGTCPGRGTRPVAVTHEGRFFAIPQVGVGTGGRFSVWPDDGGYHEIFQNRILGVPFE
jgi:hypothetical protein